MRVEGDLTQVVVLKRRGEQLRNWAVEKTFESEPLVCVSNYPISATKPRISGNPSVTKVNPCLFLHTLAATYKAGGAGTSA